MFFSELAWQPEIQQLLTQSLAKNQLAHLYLFHGSQGSGRLHTAISLSKAILCENEEKRFCNHCLACRQIDHRNHPHFQVIEPDGSTLKIEQMRQIKKNFSMRSILQQPRVYIFLEADKMTIQAANSLLHFLEEPDAQLLVILLSENRQSILPTIQSRAQSIIFTPMSRDKMYQLLLTSGESDILLRPAVKLTAGIEQAQQLVQSTWFAEMRNVMLQLAKESSSNFALASITLQNKIIKTELSEHIVLFIDLFILWYKDMIQLHVRVEKSLVFHDQLDWMRVLASKRSLSKWLDLMGQALEIQKRLRFNANTQLLMEKMLVQLQEG